MLCLVAMPDGKLLHAFPGIAPCHHAGLNLAQA
jgi:hypothetical protein